RVADEEASHLGLASEDAPAVAQVRAHALEHAVRAALLAHEHDRRRARRRRDEGRDQERRRMPEIEEEAAADEAAADREPAQHMLHALRAAVFLLREEVGIET